MVEFERASYSYGETPDDVIRERVAGLKQDQPFIEKRGKYEMLLNPTDLLTIVHALEYYSERLGGDPGDGASDMLKAEAAEADNAEGLRSSILETLGIEEI